MAVVFNDAFTATGPTALDSYDSASWREIASANGTTSGAGEITVASNQAECRFNGVFDFGTEAGTQWATYRCIASGLPTGEQSASLAVTKNHANNFGAPMVRMPTDDADTGYLFQMTQSASGNNRIIRRIGGVNTVLATGGSTPDPATTYTVTGTAEGTGATVTLTMQGAGASFTFDDTSGSRLTSGTPGIWGWHEGWSATAVFMDDFEADDLDAGGIAAPTNLSATVISNSQIDLSWDAVTGADGYDIERNTAVIVVKHGTNSYSDTGLDPSTEYTYRVRTVEDTTV